MIIPDEGLILLTVITLLYRLMLVAFGIMQPADIMFTLISTLAAFLFMLSLWFVTGGAGMGLGDVKLIVPLALLLGWPEIAVGIFAAFVVGAVFGLGLVGLRRAQLKQPIPFGPFLIIGAAISLIWGDQLFGWYLAFLR